MVKASLPKSRVLRRSVGLAVLTATVIAGYSVASLASSISDEPPTSVEVAHQVATWGASPLADRTGLQFSNQTYRDIVHAGIGGKNLRIRLQARGIRVLGGTPTPFAGSGTYNDAREQTREAVNTWIRTSGAFDGVVDFDRAVRDPGNPLALLPAYHSGDHLHPDDQGYAAMANAVDLEEL